MDEQAHSIDEFMRLYRIGRTKTFEEIAAGRLIVAKVGKRTLIPAERAREWLRNCEVERRIADVA